jgi:hypothetical protein
MNDTTLKREPAKVWVRKVESQFRIRLNKEAAEHVKWLQATKGFSANCIVRLGPNGQLLLLPNNEEAAFQKLKSSLEKFPAKADDISAPWIELARYFATAWKVLCTFEETGKRFTFVLPKEARDLEIVPGENEVVVIFNTGEILEIWHGSKWVQHISKISSNLDRQLSLGLEALENRDNG